MLVIVVPKTNPRLMVLRVPDPYIHKQVADAMMAFFKQMQEQGMSAPVAMNDDVPSEETGDDDEMMWDTADVGDEEEGAMGGDEMGMDEGMGMDNGMDKMGGEPMAMGHDDGSDIAQVVEALNQIKGILSQADFMKQQAVAFDQKVDQKFAKMKEDIVKSIQDDNSKAVNSTVTKMLKSQGLAPTVSEAPKRIDSGNTMKSVVSPMGLNDAKDITGDIQKSEDVSDESERVASVHDNFVAQVEAIVSKSAVDDLRSAFRLTNAMREQEAGGSLGQTLYYYGK